MPRAKGTTTIQTHLHDEDLAKWRRVIEAIREETRLDVSEAEVLRKLIRDKEATLEPAGKRKK